jgi:C4-dicarboxylate-specific signal transduction histidine kinase
VVIASVFALLIYTLMRRALLQSVLHRLAEVATSQRLASQLEEIERAHAQSARLQDQLLHSQRLEAVGTLAAGVAHDMKNVLASITSFADLVLGQTTDPVVRADLQQVMTQADRGAVLTNSLLAFSRRGQYRRQVVRLTDVLGNVIPLLGRRLPKSIETDGPRRRADRFSTGEQDSSPVPPSFAPMNRCPSRHARPSTRVTSFVRPALA